MDARDAARDRRWLRPDWERWLRPDWENYVQPAHREAMRREIAERKGATEGWRCARERLRDQQIAREHEQVIAVRKMRADIAWEQVKAVWAQVFARKGGFKPDQPRVPAGSSDGGRWTSQGGGISDPRVISDAAPDNDWKPGAQYAGNNSRRPPTLGHNRPPPDIPPKRPEESRERTAAIRETARFLATIYPVARRAAALASIFGGAAWLRQYRDEITTDLDPPRTLKELQDSVATPRSGTEVHHNVELAAAKDAGYPKSLYDGPDNLLRIPKQKHQQISNWMQTNNLDDKRFGGRSPREWLSNKTWEERREFGLEVLEKFKVLKR